MIRFLILVLPHWLVKKGIAKYLLLLSPVLFIVPLIHPFHFERTPEPVVYQKIEVHVVNEEKKTAEKVYEQNQNFNWDPESEHYNICIGELTPTTYDTTCAFEAGKLIITHFIGSTSQKQEPMCFYMNKEKTSCRTGNYSGPQYLEKELIN